MPDGISIEIAGLADLQKQLDALSKEGADRAVRKALRAGAALEQAAITERAPIKDVTGGILPAGALKTDIVVRLGRDRQGTMQAIVGPGKYTRRVAAWVEYGHRLVRGGDSKLLRNGKTRGPGSQTGSVEEHPFIRPAYESSQAEVANAIVTTLAKAIEKESEKS